MSLSNLESKFKSRVSNDLNALPNTYWFVKEALALRGIPDIIACVNGTFVALELKRNKVEAMKNKGRIVLQRYNIDLINKSGGFALIVYPEIWFNVLNELKKLSK